MNNSIISVMCAYDRIKTRNIVGGDDLSWCDMSYVFSVIKILMYIVMRQYEIATVQALCTDHRNDTLANLVALFAGLAGTKLRTYEYSFAMTL